MTDRRGDQGFSVAPQRIGNDGGPGRSRVRRIGFGLVLVASAAIVTIAWLGPRLNDRPSFDTSFFATSKPSGLPSGSPSATPTVEPFSPAGATPLPIITRPDGPVPIGQVAIQSDVFRILDLASGSIVTGPPTQFYRDSVFGPSTGSGWTCICLSDSQDAAGPTLEVRLDNIDPSGRVGVSTELTTLPAVPETADGQSPLTTDVAVFDEARHGLLAIARRKGSKYQFSVSPIDVDGRRLGAAIRIGDAAVPPLPAPSPAPSATDDPTVSDQEYTYVDGPHIRVSPDGRVAFIWASIQHARDSVPEGATAIHAWRVTLGPDGSIDGVAEAPGLVSLPTYCGLIGFASADRLAWLCPDQSSVGNWQFGTLDLDGNPTGTVDLTLDPNGNVGEPLFDRANGMAYVWDASALSITRIDVHTLAVEKSSFDPLAGSSIGLAPGGGAAPVDWHDSDSSVQQNGFNTINGGLDGERMYAIGYGPQPYSDPGNQPSLGIFVIDRATLALVDRWAPAADYMAVTALPNGLVAAAGLPGVDEQGRLAPWEASLTIHDAADGRILLRFGQLGTDSPAIVVGH
ncbi:MAG: hypothetical protein QOI00_1641 [Chloroflexota bacterium]|jgi:hypothetical protein|nr:hypothetical protein [Chloroflexota bacterium]